MRWWVMELWTGFFAFLLIEYNWGYVKTNVFETLKNIFLGIFGVQTDFFQVRKCFIEYSPVKLFRKDSFLPLKIEIWTSYYEVFIISIFLVCLTNYFWMETPGWLLNIFLWHWFGNLKDILRDNVRRKYYFHLRNVSILT